MGAKKMNPGWFRVGEDARRKPLTRAARQRGYAVLMAGGRGGRLPAHVIAWVWRRIRGAYRKQKGKVHQ